MGIVVTRWPGSYICNYWVWDDWEDGSDVLAGFLFKYWVCGMTVGMEVTKWPGSYISIGCVG